MSGRGCLSCCPAAIGQQHRIGDRCWYARRVRPGSGTGRGLCRGRISVDPNPGASAPLTAAVASGFPLIPLTIFGFPPRRSKDRKAWFSEVRAVKHTVDVFRKPASDCRHVGRGGSYIGLTTNFAGARADEEAPGVRSEARSNECCEQLEQARGGDNGRCRP